MLRCPLSHVRAAFVQRFCYALVYVILMMLMVYMFSIYLVTTVCDEILQICKTRVGVNELLAHNMYSNGHCSS